MRKLLSLLLLVATVAAQSPSFSGVTLTADADQVSVSIEESREVILRVTNNADGGTPMDQANRIVLQVDGIPMHWTASISPNELSLLPGESGTATLRVGVAAAATVETTTLTVVATSYSPTAPLTGPGQQVLDPLGPVLDPLDPVIDPATGDAFEPTGQSSVEISAARTDTLTRQVLEGVGVWIWAVLGGVVVLALLLIGLVVAGKRGGIRVGVREADLTVKPGGSVDATILLENPSQNEQTVALEAKAGKGGLLVSLATRELVLDGYTSQEIVMTIDAPKAAKPGVEKIGITAGTTGRARNKAEAVLRVTVQE